MVVDEICELTTKPVRDLPHKPALPFNSNMSLGNSTGPSGFSDSELTSEPAADSLGSVWNFARNQCHRSPARVLRFLSDVSTDVPRQLEILRLMRVPAFADFIKANPRFRFKFLIPDYLVRGFSTAQQSACFLHHYKRLYASMSADFLHQALHRSVTVFEVRRNDIHVEITLSSRPFEKKEGELTLNLHVDGVLVFVLSFTIVPGWVVQSEDPEVLMISRLQGAYGRYPEIRAATKAMHNVGPAALLLGALDGFAQTFNIRQMAGVSADRQSSYTEELSVFYRKAYDDFFTEIGVPKSSCGFFLSSIPAEERPLSSIKQGHKIRTREKRQFKRQVAEEVCLLLRQGLSVKESEIFVRE
jgi:uncharacterized protein VirK/YbjX